MPSPVTSRSGPAGPVFTADSRWIRRASRSRPRLRLICLPFAGGGASIYQRLPGLLPPSIEVIALQLPGREDRTREDPPGDLSALTAAAAVALRPYLHVPFAFYGHCAGALLGYEVAHEIGARFGKWPSMLVAAAQPAPRLPTTSAPLHRLPDARLLEVVGDRGGLPPAVARRPDLVEMLLPLLRSDFTLWERYTAQPRGRMPCPVLTVRGRDDLLVDATVTEPWAEESSVGWRELLVDGGHYFINGLGRADADAIGRALLVSVDSVDQLPTA
jgi:medium-chain acyl-[acyl-carrier-protein] hydrolase